MAVGCFSEEFCAIPINVSTDMKGELRLATLRRVGQFQKVLVPSRITTNLFEYNNKGRSAGGHLLIINPNLCLFLLPLHSVRKFGNILTDSSVSFIRASVHLSRII